MTIYLPPGKWALRKYKIKHKTNRAYVKTRTFFDWKYPYRNKPDLISVRRVKVRHPETGKKFWMVLQKVKFGPLFKINTNQPIDPASLVYLRFNPIDTGEDND